MSPTKNQPSDRRKARRARRRLKRDVMQNHMLLRGWVPVVLNDQFGIYHPADNKLVLRQWRVLPQAMSAFPFPGLPDSDKVPAPAGVWTYQCMQLATSLTKPFDGQEIAWKDIQLRWVFAMRASLIQKGWL